MQPALGKRFALAGAALGAFATGSMLPFAAQRGMATMTCASLLSMEIPLFLLFAWIQFDRRQRGVPRSRGFNFALANFMLVAAPVYFVRHRERGDRWKPLLGLFAAAIGWNVALLLGVFAGALLAFALHGAN